MDGMSCCFNCVFGFILVLVLFKSYFSFSFISVLASVAHTPVFTVSPCNAQYGGGNYMEWVGRVGVRVGDRFIGTGELLATYFADISSHF